MRLPTISARLTPQELLRNREVYAARLAAHAAAPSLFPRDHAPLPQDFLHQGKSRQNLLIGTDLLLRRRPAVERLYLILMAADSEPLSESQEVPSDLRDYAGLLREWPEIKGTFLNKYYEPFYGYLSPFEGDSFHNRKILAVFAQASPLMALRQALQFLGAASGVPDQLAWTAWIVDQLHEAERFPVLEEYALTLFAVLPALQKQAHFEQLAVDQTRLRLGVWKAARQMGGQSHVQQVLIRCARELNQKPAKT